MLTEGAGYSPAMAPDTVWEIVFLMVILKIPIVYLCFVIYYAIKAKPTPETGAAVTAETGPDDSDGGWRRRLRHPVRPSRPHGGPARSYPRAPLSAPARAQAKP